MRQTDGQISALLNVPYCSRGHNNTAIFASPCTGGYSDYTDLVRCRVGWRRRRFDDDDLVVARRQRDRHPRRHRRLRRAATEQAVLVVPAAPTAARRLTAGSSLHPAAAPRRAAAARRRRVPPRAADSAGVEEVTPAAVGAAHPDQDAPKLVPDEAVDEEVGGRVEGQQRVGNGHDAVADSLVIQLYGRHQFLQSDGDAQTDVGQLARDEHADDHHQRQGDVLPGTNTRLRTSPDFTCVRQGDVLALLVAASQVAMAAPHLSQSADEAGVEADEQQERPDGAKHEVADGPVDDEVPVVESQIGDDQLSSLLQMSIMP